MARLRDKRDCPFCGQEVVLGECPIVATNTAYPDSAPAVMRKADYVQKRRVWTDDDDVVDDDHADDDNAGDKRFKSQKPRPASGAEILTDDAGAPWWIGEYPVVAYAPALPDRGRLARGADLLKPLPPLRDSAAPEDLPARACTSCGNPLPPDLDDRSLFIIALVGTSGAGKSSYLASTLEAAYRKQELASIGCNEFAPDEDTESRFHRDYYTTIFRKRNVLEMTKHEQNEDVRLKPLVFRVQFDGGPPSVLLFHDIAGEHLSDRAGRNRVAPFLRRADAVIFLVDPYQIDDLEEQLPHLHRATAKSLESARARS